MNGQKDLFQPARPDSRQQSVKQAESFELNSKSNLEKAIMAYHTNK